MTSIQPLESHGRADAARESRLNRLKTKRIQLNFDLTDGCNLNCIMCGNVPNRNRANQHVMPMEVFRQNLVPSLAFVQDFSYGCYFEPMMTPYFADALFAVAGQLPKGVRGSMTTNGTMLTDENVRAIVDSDIFQKVRISVDAVTEELFDRIRKGARFPRVIANVKKLANYARDQKKALTLEFNFTKMRENIHELPDVVSLAKSCGVHSINTHKLSPGDCLPIDKAYHDQLMHYIAEAKSRARESGIAYTGQDDYQLAGQNPKEPVHGWVSTVPRTCAFSQGWLLLTINSRGDLTIPCHHASGKLGSVAQTPLDELLVSDLCTNRLDRFDASVEEICGPCAYYRAVPGVSAPAKSSPSSANGARQNGQVKSKMAAPPAKLPPAAEQRLKEADAAYARGDLHNACECLEDALLHAPSAAPLHLCLGNLKFQLNDYVGALQAYQLADQSDPGNPDALTRLAAAARGCGQVELAETVLSQTLKLSPTHPAALQLMGHLKFDRRLYADAALHYCGPLAKGTADVNLLLHLGKCHFELQDHPSAHWCFRRVLRMEPGNAIALEAVQILAVPGGGVAPAAASSTRSEPPVDTAQETSLLELLSRTLAFCSNRVDHQHFTAAWQALCRAVCLAPQRGDVRVFRGQLALFLKDVANAREDFSAALAIEPDNAVAKAGLARCQTVLAAPKNGQVALPTDVKGLRSSSGADQTPARPRAGKGKATVTESREILVDFSGSLIRPLFARDDLKVFREELVALLARDQTAECQARLTSPAGEQARKSGLWFQRVPLYDCEITTNSDHSLYKGGNPGPLNTLWGTLSAKEGTLLRPCPKWTYLRKVLPPVADKTVLEIGSACGFFPTKFAAMGAAFSSGIEIIPQLVAQARWAAQVNHLEDRTLFVHTDAYLDPSVPPHDIVFMSEVLFHSVFPDFSLLRALNLAKSYLVIDDFVSRNPEQPACLHLMTDPKNGKISWTGFTMTESVFFQLLYMYGVEPERVTRHYDPMGEHTVFVIDTSDIPNHRQRIVGHPSLVSSLEASMTENKYAQAIATAAQVRAEPAPWSRANAAAESREPALAVKSK